MTLWLWLMILPLAISGGTGTWGTCLTLALAYMILFSLDTAIVSLGGAENTGIAVVLLRDDAMILAVALASHGVLRAFRQDGR